MKKFRYLIFFRLPEFFKSADVQSHCAVEKRNKWWYCPDGPVVKKSNSLKSQVKKGLTSIVVTASRRRSTQAAYKQPKLVTSSSLPRGDSPPLHLQASFDSSGSNSLPSSQEEESVRRLQEKLRLEQLDVSKVSTSSESDQSYHSASEGT